jgi:hypothetical protein
VNSQDLLQFSADCTHCSGPVSEIIRIIAVSVLIIPDVNAITSAYGNE